METKHISLGVISILMIVFVVFALSAAGGKHKKLMEECMHDGNKEYECESMLKSNDSYPLVVPMVIR